MSTQSTRSHAKRTAPIHILFLPLLLLVATSAYPAQQPDGTAIIHAIDAAAEARFANLRGFTVTEHYAVYRGDDETRPAAEMSVKTTYRKDFGKSYEILSQSGSEIIRKFALQPLLDHEKEINLPGNVQKSWFTSSNYEMKLKPGVTQVIDGRKCLAISMSPRRKAPNMIEGILWLDTKDNSLAKIEGVASKSPSVFAGIPLMMRSYVTIDGYAMAHYSRAESTSLFFGRTVVTIDYRDYQLQLNHVK
ncbi:MAG: hypothetical protein ABSG51_14435 [Terracidiphilus sp.]